MADAQGLGPCGSNPVWVQIPLPAHNIKAGVAQRQSNRFVSDRSRVQIPPPAQIKVKKYSYTHRYKSNDI